MFNIWVTLIQVVVVFGATMLGIMVCTYLERRVSAFLQDRLGPNRTGPKGLLQPVADGIKFFIKEDIIPDFVIRWLYILSPGIMMAPALLGIAVIPFGKPFEAFGVTIPMQIANLNIGVLYILAMTSIGIYGLILGGWSSNSKYPLLGGLRSSAQMISYELTMGLAIVSVLMATGSMLMTDIIAEQMQNGWFFWRQPLAFVLFWIAIFAETNRLPFDMTEAEQELVGGYHTEYSSMKFAMFFMGEYASMITVSALITTLFLGGWAVPFVSLETLNSFGIWGTLLSVASFVAKTGFFILVYIWVRWTLPRFRYDQLMRLGWKVLLPVALFNIVLTGVLMAVFK